MFLPVHKKVKYRCSEEESFNDLREEVAELTIARRDCIRHGNDTDENPDENMVKEAVDVVLTAYDYLALITKGDPNSALDKVIADNVRRGKYDEDTVSAIAHHGNSKVVESLKEVLEELR